MYTASIAQWLESCLCCDWCQSDCAAVMLTVTDESVDLSLSTMMISDMSNQCPQVDDLSPSERQRPTRQRSHSTSSDECHEEPRDCSDEESRDDAVVQSVTESIQVEAHPGTDEHGSVMDNTSVMQDPQSDQPCSVDDISPVVTDCAADDALAAAHVSESVTDRMFTADEDVFYDAEMSRDTVIDSCVTADTESVVCSMCQMTWRTLQDRSETDTLTLSNGRADPLRPSSSSSLSSHLIMFLSALALSIVCLLYTSPSPRDRTRSRMPSSA